MSAKPKNPIQQATDMRDILNGLMSGPQGKSNNWYQSYHYPETVNFHPENIINCARSALYSQAISEGTVYEVEKNFALQQEGPPILEKDNLDELIKSFDGRLIYQFEQQNCNGLFYAFSDGAVYVHCSPNTSSLSLTIVTTNESKIDRFNQYYKSCVKC